MNAISLTAAFSLLAVGIVSGQPGPHAGSVTGGNTPAIALPGLPPKTIPSGIVPPACKPFVVKVPTDALLSCYLNDPSNHTIADGITWMFGPGQFLSWPQWPSWAKADLSKRFIDTAAWHNTGMNRYPGTLVQDPPPPLNMDVITTNAFAPATYDEATVAFPLYSGNIAMNLASEIYGLVPWSLHNYDPSTLSYVFNYNNYFWHCDQYGATGWCVTLDSMPANATYTFKFLKTNNLIGATRVETISRVLDWARWNLWHTGGSFNYAQYFKYFDYFGSPPVSRIIAGTVTTDAYGTPPDWLVTPHHWTAGCGGTSAFLATVLRTIGIPTWVASAGGGHHSPWFVADKMYLSHGDDPYDALSKTEVPAQALLLDEATYKAKFPANDPVTAAKNTAFRPMELNFQYPSPWVMDRYCNDIANGKDHASGEVYGVFKRIYTLQEVEASGLWTVLDQKIGKYACQM